MNYKKMENCQSTTHLTSDPTVDDVKMVRITIEIPFPVESTYIDIKDFVIFEWGVDLPRHMISVEESAVTLKELSDFGNQNFNIQWDNFCRFDSTCYDVKDVVKNTPTPKSKPKSTTKPKKGK